MLVYNAVKLFAPSIQQTRFHTSCFVACDVYKVSPLSCIICLYTRQRVDDIEERDTDLSTATTITALLGLYYYVCCMTAIKTSNHIHHVVLSLYMPTTYQYILHEYNHRAELQYMLCKIKRSR